jgi:hypothetical protein
MYPASIQHSEVRGIEATLMRRIRRRAVLAQDLAADSRRADESDHTQRTLFVVAFGAMTDDSEMSTIPDEIRRPSGLTRGGRD